MICLGVDQSYKQIGIAIVDNENIINVKSYNFKGLKTKTEKRRFVQKLIIHAIQKYKPDIIMTERIRTFSQSFLSTNYIKATGALVAVIVDSAFPQKVYSCDTRSWKSRICGKASGDKKGDKMVSVNFVKRKYSIELNDDAADSLCIALYGAKFNQYKKLIKEET